MRNNAKKKTIFIAESPLPIHNQIETVAVMRGEGHITVTLFIPKVSQSNTYNTTTLYNHPCKEPNNLKMKGITSAIRY